MTPLVDMNCDMGESFGCYTLGNDEAILDWVSSVNIACGLHAGDYNVMRRVVQLAKKKDVAIGAHPGYHDLVGFGRRKMEITPGEVYNLVLYQVGALHAFVHAEGVKLHHVKPHGALYNTAAVDKATAEAIVRAITDFDDTLVLYSLAGSLLTCVGREHELEVKEEVFADRTYQADGTLTPRGESRAVITHIEQAVHQARTMVTQGIVIAVDGSEIPIQADTICIHGDHADAVVLAEELYKCLAEVGAVD